MQKRYAIIDIETTGGRAARDKITEIAIVIHDGARVIDTFESLVNPECPIPYGITELTGISNEMVASAPKFYEIARQVVEKTEGCIFVAHNVRFDYSFIQEEFRRLGFTYSRKQLCTVRLSRKVFPGLRSYSLGNLIQHFNIKVDDRHRAMADTLATVDLFERILAQEKAEEDVLDLVNMGVKESLLPQNFTIEMLHQLPEACGVYYFHDRLGEVVYVGKSKNIKKRVMQHFSKKDRKGALLQQFVHELTFEITGSELVALLHESYEIKRLRPKINRAQRMRHFPFVIHSFKNEAGYICFDVLKTTAKTRKKLEVISEYPRITNAKGTLENAMKQYELCAGFCNIYPGNGACFNFHLNLCLGACAGQESAEDYNARALDAIEHLRTVFKRDFFIIDNGRTEAEKAVVLVEDGQYQGFGYFDSENGGAGLEVLRDSIKLRPGNPETARIVMRFLDKNVGVKVIPF